MTFTKLFGLAAVAIVCPMVPTTPAQAAPAIPANRNAADFKPQAEALVAAAFPADGPGAAVIVTRGGKIVYSAGRGLADVEGKRPITPDTPIRLGSIVKQFTAAVVLQLVGDGKISPDDPIARFFPDWPQPGAGATVRQLLNHTSGIQDFTKIPGWISKNRHRAWTTAELLAVTRALPAKSKPGEEWEYNNGGYVVLGAIVEKVTGKPWHEVLAERITGPLGLKTIAYAAPGDIGDEAARGYTGGGQPVQLSHMSVAHAAGGLHGSVSDMARWAHALHHGKVVSAALYQEMIRPARLTDGTAEPYGFGLRLRQIRGRKALVHGGAGGGLDTDSVYIPSEDLFVAAFANSDQPASDPSILTRRLAALALRQAVPTFTPAPVQISAVEPLFGTYAGHGGPPLRFFARDGKLFVGRGEDEKEAFAAGEDRFFFGPNDLTWFSIKRQPGGAHLMDVHTAEAAAPIRSVRTGSVPPPLTVEEDVLRSYAGTYSTETITVTVALEENGRLTITPAGQSTSPMRPVSQTEFRLDGTPMRVVFHPENGKVERLTIHRGARELHGKRVAE